MDFHFSHDVFHGPLDLLLYLVKRHEVDVFDIPIALIVRQFQEHVAALQAIDFEAAGEFLVMTATLMEIKSRMLLPRETPTEEPADDPRMELVRQLVEYRAFKDAAARLEEQADKAGRRLARQLIPEPRPATTVPVRPVELWDLVSAFGRLMRETLNAGPSPVITDETPLQLYMDELVERLGGRAGVPFREVFSPPLLRTRLVGLFLALLELMKEGRLRAEQGKAFGEIVLTAATPIDRLCDAAIGA